MKRVIKKTDYTMTYFHPRDFDPNQPMLEGLSLRRRFKSYYNLSTSYTKLKQLIYDFEFVDLREARALVDWDKAPIVDLSHYSDNK
jgi:hypothetical protein